MESAHTVITTKKLELKTLLTNIFTEGCITYFKEKVFIKNIIKSISKMFLKARMNEKEIESLTQTLIF